MLRGNFWTEPSLLRCRTWDVLFGVLFNSAFINSTSGFFTTLDSRFLRTIACWQPFNHHSSLNSLSSFLSSFDIPTTRSWSRTPFSEYLAEAANIDGRDTDGPLGLSTFTLYRGLAYVSPVSHKQCFSHAILCSDETVGKRVVLYGLAPLHFHGTFRATNVTSPSIESRGKFQYFCSAGNLWNQKESWRTETPNAKTAPSSFIETTLFTILR